MSDEKQRLADIVGSAEVVPLKPEETALGAVILFKVLTNKGEMNWALRHFGDLSQVEVIGALSVTLDWEQSDYLNGWEEDEDGA